MRHKTETEKKLVFVVKSCLWREGEMGGVCQAWRKTASFLPARTDKRGRDNIAAEIFIFTGLIDHQGAKIRGCYGDKYFFWKGRLDKTTLPTTPLISSCPPSHLRSEK
jgi:hypothetical protein